MASYTVAGDRLRFDDSIAVFTDDAVLESEGVPELDAFRYEGRQAIRQWITRWLPAAGKAPTTRATFVRHHLSTTTLS